MTIIKYYPEKKYDVQAWHKVTGNTALLCAGWRRNNKFELRKCGFGVGWILFCFALLFGHITWPAGSLTRD